MILCRQENVRRTFKVIGRYFDMSIGSKRVFTAYKMPKWQRIIT